MGDWLDHKAGCDYMAARLSASLDAEPAQALV
jgi:hypothetical protein